MKFLTAVLIICGAAAAVSAQSSDFVGYRHKGVIVGEKLPNGARDEGGGLMPDDEYGVTRYTLGRRTFLWLERIAGRDAAGVPDWIVRDVVEIGKTKRNREFLFSYSTPCTLRGAAAIDTVVMAAPARKKKRYDIKRAWRVDTEAERFVEIPTAGIECGAPPKRR